MSGGKGGSTTSQVQIPQYLEDAARRNLSRASQISNIGYTPYFGADVAAMTPMQQASMQGTNQMASAFGLPSVSDPMAGMPQAQDFGGMQAYSSAPMYEQSLQSLAQNRPEQYQAIEGMFNPTGGTSYGGGYGGGSGYGTATGGGVSASDVAGTALAGYGAYKALPAVASKVGGLLGIGSGGSVMPGFIGGGTPVPEVVVEQLGKNLLPSMGFKAASKYVPLAGMAAGIFDGMFRDGGGEATRKRLEKERTDRILAPIMQEIEANDPTPQGMTRMEYNLMKNPNKYATKSLTDDELEQQYYNTGLL